MSETIYTIPDGYAIEDIEGYIEEGAAYSDLLQDMIEQNAENCRRYVLHGQVASYKATDRVRRETDGPTIIACLVLPNRGATRLYGEFELFGYNEEMTVEFFISDYMLKSYNANTSSLIHSDYRNIFSVDAYRNRVNFDVKIPSVRGNGLYYVYIGINENNAVEYYLSDYLLIEDI